ncbi:hypothetical protein LENED_012365 [Lentinula edodes]|uniref:BTB domain-containing protein n=1 Tax=Lentinula edodes TaxID=5353 RepID=A0A1Q3ESE7_LENED|nr:hypothetical protein LENED_012365 [Lentinula edodes]
MSDRSLEPKLQHLSIVKKYYMPGGDLYFQAENSLFKVHRYFFDRESPKFQDMLSRPPPTGQAAYGSLNNPVVLDVTSEEFQQLLWVFYNPVYTYEEAKLEDWACILSLACHYKFPEISLYQEYKVDEDLLIPLYAQLCARDRTLSLLETHKLGYETAVMVFQAREHLRSPADRGKSPLPDDIEEGEVEDTIRDLMKDLFSGNPNDNRSSLRRGISDNKHGTQTKKYTENSEASSPSRSFERHTRRDGWNAQNGDDYGSINKSQRSEDVWPDTEEESTHVQESESTTPKEEVHSEHVTGIDFTTRRPPLDDRRSSMRWSRARTFRTVSTTSVPPLPGSWSEA